MGTAINLLELAVTDIDARTDRRPVDVILAMVDEEVGRKYQPLRSQVIVRTDPLQRVTAGGLVLTARETNFYAGMGHAKILKATVVAVGDHSSLKRGERVCFQRLYFARLVELKDGTFVGSIDENELVGYIEEE